MSDKPKTKEEIAQYILANHNAFIGTTQYFRYLGGCVLTDGTKWLGDHAGCYWFFDIIASHQMLSRINCEYFQVWKIKLNKDNDGAVISCENGNGSLIATQEIESTDFPLPEFEVWAIRSGDRRVILLRSEH